MEVNAWRVGVVDRDHASGLVEMNSNLRTEHGIFARILILIPSFRRRRRFVHQLPHPRRQRLREGRGRGLPELRLGHRRLALLDFRGGQHPFIMYFFNVPRANEVLQHRSFQVAASVNCILSTGPTIV